MRSDYSFFQYSFFPGIPSRPAAIFAELECLGNYTIATQKLLTMGFGIPYVIHERLVFDHKIIVPSLRRSFSSTVLTELNT